MYFSLPSLPPFPFFLSLAPRLILFTPSPISFPPLTPFRHFLSSYWLPYQAESVANPFFYCPPPHDKKPTIVIELG
jgi:hypothetical protein